MLAVMTNRVSNMMLEVVARVLNVMLNVVTSTVMTVVPCFGGTTKKCTE